MKSIFAKVLLWCFATLIVCLAGSTMSSTLRMRYAPGHLDYFSRSLSFQVNGARDAYLTGGKPALDDYLARLQKFFPGRYVLVDQNGIDLLSGADEKEDLRRAAMPRRWHNREGRVMMAWPSHDGKYQLLIDAVIPPPPSSVVPYYLWIVLATLVFCYVLAVYLASPLRALKRAVERFGTGDLAVRAPASGRDEFSALAQAFNLMADRIQTLLTAERRLLQDVSHELRSPLARLQFAVELARNHPDRDRSLDRIQKEVERLTVLVSELLQVTRAEGDPDSRNLDEIALRELLGDVIDDSKVESQAQNVRLDFSAEEPLFVRGDRELLRRAVENVIRNAIRFAPEDSAVEVTVKRNLEDAVIAIRDRGPGVPEQCLSSLFKPFFRVESDRNRNAGGGVGLGLAIAARAVSVHHGKIRARNARPGLLVEIELPAILSPVPVEV